MKKKILLFAVMMLSATVVMAQKDSYLATLTQDIVKLRQAKANKAELNKRVINWSAKDKPKITLMNNIGIAANEYKGTGAFQFKMNQLVTFVYNRQNMVMRAGNDYFNSTDSEMYYSAIEKNVRRGESVRYTLSGHVGDQEFVVVSYDAKTKFNVLINGKVAENKANGVKYSILPNVRRGDEISIVISSDKANSLPFESFVILCHNPQK